MLCDFSNALVSFQGYINKILVEKLVVFIIIYLDIILIYIDKIEYVDAIEGHFN